MDEHSIITPDFDHWDSTVGASGVSVEGGALVVMWNDGRTSRHHAYWLAENDPSPETLHPLSRETTLSPLSLPEDLRVAGAELQGPGVVAVNWSDGRPQSRFDAGWIRGNAFFDGDGDTGRSTPILWTGAEQPAPQSIDGPLALLDNSAFLQWLEALRDHGVARLTGLPVEDGLLMRVVERIGTIRESNFGRMYTLEIKDDPDSNAFTSDALLQHIDLPTRETPHGLQFLFCRQNSTSGGQGIYVDGFRVAGDLKNEDPESFSALCEINWEYNNRSRTSAYRASGPVIERNDQGAITGIRYNTWLRAPLRASLEDQERGYRSYRAFARKAQEARYQMIFDYRPGDLVAFDNRRVLHGRNGYDAQGGERFIEGIYSDRDDLLSAIRTTRRHLGLAPQD